MRSSRAIVIAALWLFCFGSVTAFAEDTLSLIPDQPLGSGSNERYDFDVVIDGKNFCKSEFGVYSDDDWICNGDIAAGQHTLDIAIKPEGGSEIHVNGVVVLRPEDRVSNDPEQEPDYHYWCVLVSKTRVGLLSKSDKLCHSS